MTFLRKSIEHILGIILKKSVFNYCILKSESSYNSILLIIRNIQFKTPPKV